MSDPDTPSDIARALRALPELAPPADGWPRLRRRLGRRRAPARPLWVALAAGAAALAALVLAPLLERGASVPETAAVAPQAAAPPGVVPALAARSAALERLLETLPPARAARAGTVYTTTLLEDRIALVDERLSTPDARPLPPATAAALLRERVALLDSLVRVRTAAVVGQTL